MWGKQDSVLHSQSNKTCSWGGELEEQSDQYCSNHCPAYYHGLIGTLWKTTERINDERMQTTQEPRQARSKYNSSSQGTSPEYVTKYTKKALKPSEHSTVQASSQAVQFCVIYIEYKYIWCPSTQRHSCAFWAVCDLQLHSYALHRSTERQIQCALLNPFPTKNNPMVTSREGGAY